MKKSWIDLRSEAYCIERKLPIENAKIFADGFREAKRLASELVEEESKDPDFAEDVLEMLEAIND